MDKDLVVENYSKIAKNSMDMGLLSRAAQNKLESVGVVLGSNIVNSDSKKSSSNGEMVISDYYYNLYKDNHGYNSKLWEQKSIVNHDNDFWLWINSMTFDYFPNKLDYKKFELYKAQAKYYYDNAKNPYDYDNSEMRRDIIMEEYSKIDVNTLYFSMQYGQVKEGSSRSGKIKYVPKEHNAVIYYLLDCGYSLIFGKPRQIFATTTIGLFIIKKLISQENFYMKFITENEKTGLEILDDKVKIAFNYLPTWLKPQLSRDYIAGFRLGKKIRKGEYALPNSRIEVVSPTKTAINGGSPQIVLVDEVGNVPELIPMVLEARPTMFIDRNQDGNLELVRQICLWGTGVSDNKGKNAFQSLWTNTLEYWEKKDFTSAMFVPLFFSWHTRCSKEVYEQEKRSYLSGNKKEFDGMSQEEQAAIFHMHYPDNWNDMFSMASNKLVPRDVITSNLNRIRDLDLSEQSVMGYFEPIYDYSVKYDDNFYVPYKIIGSRFVAIDDEDDNTIPSVSMYKKPDYSWENRYYMGTDPIMAETGLSLFACSIWDVVEERPICILNHRQMQEPRASYLQALLLSLYYDNNTNGNKIGVPELIENNIGTSYKEFREVLGYDKNLIYNGDLSEQLRGGGAYWGINSKAHRKQVVVSKLSECVMTYGSTFMHSIIFKQLDTYGVVIKSTGATYEPIDKRLYRDDVLDAVAFSYIARQSFSHKPPKQIEHIGVNKPKTAKRQLIRVNGMLTVKYVYDSK